MDHCCRNCAVLEIKVDDLVGKFFELRNIVLLPLLCKCVRVDRHYGAVVCEHGVNFVRCCFRRNDCCVDITAYLLCRPVISAYAESLVEILAGGAPPAAYAEVHRRDRIGAVQIVVPPHQLLLFFVLPFYGILVITKKCCIDFVFGHYKPSLKI